MHNIKNEWHRIIWIDEFSVELRKHSHAPLVWHWSEEEYNKRCIVPTFKSGRTSIMVWDCIAYNLKGSLIFILKDKRSG